MESQLRMKKNLIVMDEDYVESDELGKCVAKADRFSFGSIFSS